MARALPNLPTSLLQEACQACCTDFMDALRWTGGTAEGPKEHSDATALSECVLGSVPSQLPLRQQLWTQAHDSCLI